MATISPVYITNPVFAVTPALTLGGGAPGAGAGVGSGTVVNPPVSTTDPAYVTFRKADYSAQAAHGGPVPAYPTSVTLAAVVTVSGTPALISAHARTGGEDRPLARMTFKIVTAEDPAIYLGAKLATDDQIDWAGFRLLAIGTAFPVGTTFETIGHITI